MLTPKAQLSSNTGPKSNNQVFETTNRTVTVSNSNQVNVTNNSSQSATSGNARVSSNTNGGSATVVVLANISNTSTTVSVFN